MFLCLYKPSFCLVQQGQELSSVRTFQSNGSIHLHQSLAQRQNQQLHQVLGNWKFGIGYEIRIWESMHVYDMTAPIFYAIESSSPTSASFKLSLCFGNSTLNQKFAAEQGNLSSAKHLLQVLPAVPKKGYVCQRDLHLPRGMQMLQVFWSRWDMSLPSQLTSEHRKISSTQSDRCFSESYKATTERVWEVLAEKGNSRRGTRAVGQVPFQVQIFLKLKKKNKQVFSSRRSRLCSRVTTSLLSPSSLCLQLGLLAPLALCDSGQWHPRHTDKPKP